MRPSRTPALSRLLLLGLLVPAPAAPAPAPAPAPAAVAAPAAIPALRQWEPGRGSFSFGPGSRLVVDADGATRLADTARVTAEDLTRLTGSTVPVVTAASPRPGDLVLRLGGEDRRPDAYTLTVGRAATVSAADTDGVFYGTRTVLQLLGHSRTIPRGTAHDWSAYPERGLMVDVGRKYFTLPWLRRQIRDLAYVKMNYLHLHLSDNLGFRLESSTHPEITSPQHYTKQEISDLIAFARRYHVTVVPEIDMPGHLDAVLAAHPELRLTDRDGRADPSFIDLSNPASYALMKDLITEYLPLFPGGYWHLGADEYVPDYGAYPQLLDYARQHYGAGAKAKDAFYGFVNWADELVRAGGRTMRMWNDGIKGDDGTVAPAADITVDHWSSSGLNPRQLSDAGHAVMNASSHTYYVYGKGKPDAAYLYQDWRPGVFEGGTTLDDPDRNLGSVLHVWCDDPGAETEQQTADGIEAPIRVLAQQTWGSPRPTGSYADFRKVIDSVGRAPGGPGSGSDDAARGRPVLRPAA